MPMVTTSLGYNFAFRSLGIIPNPLSTLQKIRMIINSVVMRYLQFGFSTLIVGVSHDDFNLHHWLNNSSFARNLARLFDSIPEFTPDPTPQIRQNLGWPMWPVLTDLISRSAFGETLRDKLLILEQMT